MGKGDGGGQRKGRKDDKNEKEGTDIGHIGDRWIRGSKL